MTSQVKISAHCADDKNVVVKVKNGPDCNQSILENGEELELSFYDDISVSVKEVISPDASTNAGGKGKTKPPVVD